MSGDKSERSAEETLEILKATADVALSTFTSPFSEETTKYQTFLIAASLIAAAVVSQVFIVTEISAGGIGIKGTIAVNFLSRVAVSSCLLYLMLMFLMRAIGDLWKAEHQKPAETGKLVEIMTTISANQTSIHTSLHTKRGAIETHLRSWPTGYRPSPILQSIIDSGLSRQLLTSLFSDDITTVRRAIDDYEGALQRTIGEPDSKSDRSIEVSRLIQRVENAFVEYRDEIDRSKDQGHFYVLASEDIMRLIKRRSVHERLRYSLEIGGPVLIALLSIFAMMLGTGVKST